MIPFDERPPMQTSGLRLGTPALSTRGMGSDEMRTVVALIDRVLTGGGDDVVIQAARGEVRDLCAQFPLNKAH